MSTVGHNSLTGAAREQLAQVITAIENLEEDKANVQADIASRYAEAKAFGFDVKVLRAIIRRRKQDKATVEEFEALLGLYLHAIGDLA